jgi:hypothetical protein
MKKIDFAVVGGGRLRGRGDDGCQHELDEDTGWRAAAHEASVTHGKATNTCSGGGGRSGMHERARARGCVSGVGPWERARAELSPLTSVGPPPSDRSYPYFRRPDHRPMEVKITSASWL